MQCNPNSLVIGIKVALLGLLGWVAAGAAFGTAPGAHAQAAATERLSYLDILTAAPTDTPGGEPEWDILQYVVTANPSWTCGPINGTPGHRTLECYTGAGHRGVGTVDNYGDPGSASANWMQRRANALATYPVFRDTSWNGYPGYHAEGPMPPYNFFTQEDYYWADVRVLGGTRVDDTHFYYAPDIATAIMNAAEQLGYLPTPSPTPTSSAIVTPTFMPTVTRTATPTSSASVTQAVTRTGTPASTPASSTLTPSVTPSLTPTSSPSVTPISTPTPCTIQFTDVPEDSTFYVYIRCLACRGIVAGYDDNTFKPDSSVTRGQLSKIISNAANFNDPPGSQLFEDVPPGSTFYDYIQRLGSRGFISGYDCGGPGEPCSSGNLPYFRPGNNATRGQISKIVSNAAGFSDPPGAQQFEDVAPGSSFYDYVHRLSSRGVMQGYPCGGPGEPCSPTNLPYFRPYNNATRGQTSKIVSNTFFPDCQTPARH
jgi:hypothetical protein